MTQSLKKLALLCIICSLLINVVKAETQKEKQRKIKENSEKTFEIDGKKYKVNLFQVDMKDEKNYVDIVLANDKIGSLEELKNIASTKANDTDEILAGINGTFFNLSVNVSPVNTIVKNGKIRYIGNWASLASFDGENNMTISRPGFKINGASNDQWDYPNSFSPFNINAINKEDYAVNIIDHAYTGKFPKGKLYVIAVKNKEILGIYDHIPKIPKNGYLIVAKRKFIHTNIKKGDSIEYEYKAYNLKDKKDNMSFYNVRTAIGAGPSLVRNGKIVLNPKEEGFSNHIKNSKRPRSMVGMTKDKKLYLVAAEKIDLNALSKLAIKLNLENAINLDGGGSTGLVIDGNYVKKPSRKVSNALVVRRRKKEAIRVELNGVEKFFELDPFIYNNRTMVPLRAILEDLGCKLKWDKETEEVHVDRYGEKLIFKKNSKIVRGENRNYEMDTPLIIDKSRSAIPLRFLIEFLGGDVKWIKEKKLVKIEIETARALNKIANELYKNGKFEEAMQYFEMTLKLKKDHISALKYMALIYENHFKDYRSAIYYYKKTLELFEDENVYAMLLRTYLKAKESSNAIKIVEKIDNMNKITEDILYYKAQVYKDLDKEKAIELFEKLIELRGKNIEYQNEAREYIYQNKKLNKKN